MNCPKCQKEISDDFKHCPHCGKRLTISDGNAFLKGFVTVVLILSVLGLFFGTWYTNKEKVTAHPSSTPQPTENIALSADPNKHGLVSSAYMYDRAYINWLNDCIKDYSRSQSIPLLNAQLYPEAPKVVHDLGNDISVTFYIEGNVRFIKKIVLEAPIPKDNKEANTLDAYMCFMMHTILSFDIHPDEIDQIVDDIEKSVWTESWYSHIPECWYYGDTGGIHVYTANSKMYIETTALNINPWSSIPLPAATPEARSPEDYGLVSNAVIYSDHVIGWLDEQYIDLGNRMLVNTTPGLLNELMDPKASQVRYQLTDNSSLVFYLIGSENYISGIRMITKMPTTKDEASLISCYTIPLMVLVADFADQTDASANSKMKEIEQAIGFDKWYKNIPEGYYYGSLGGIQAYSDNDLIHVYVSFERDNPWE